MDDLLEIVEVLRVHGYTIDSEQIYALKQSPLIFTLLEGIFDGRILTDEDAVKLLYSDPEKTRTYSEVKRRLKSRLIDYLFTLGDTTPATIDIRNSYYKATRELIASMILFVNGKMNVACNCALKAFKISKKFELTSVAFLSARHLNYIYSTILFDAKKSRQFYHYQIHYENLTKAETEIMQVYNIVLSCYGAQQSSIDMQKLHEICDQIDDIRTKYSKVNTYNFERYYYLSKVLFYEASNQYSKSLLFCNKAIDNLQSKNFNTSKAIESLYLRKLATQIYLREFNDALDTYNIGISDVPKGSFNWYAWQFYYFILLSHNAQYSGLSGCVQRCIYHKNFLHLHPTRKQLWHVLEAFVHFLISCDRIPRDVVEKYPLRHFRLYRFINDVPIFSKDKRGINVSILILHILFLLDRRNYTKINARVDALNQYSRRYLRKDDTFRSNCFIKMLTQIPRAEYNRQRTERYADKYYQRLIEMPIHETRQGIETEPVPYEQLWEMVLEKLD